MVEASSFVQVFLFFFHLFNGKMLQFGCAMLKYVNNGGMFNGFVCELAMEIHVEWFSKFSCVQAF
jgi:hypothetical protein